MGRRDSRAGAGQAHGAYKAAQLCAEVAEVVSLALGDAEDPRLRLLTVREVVPGGDGSRLVIVVTAEALESVEQLDELHEALSSARGWLRRQVAAEIHRKRTPDLDFRVLPPWEAGP